ncbi:TadE/TadG family type IV pilus assembly protein [Breoghania sp.]|uniref:TadE/TadG family type IV pilus assembly protein n=1 Tax=Breoghania sp. TaxID=2065378 RepID=UPI002AA8532D|nr:TadE/TadG family type IV pilus assembly protein [Breoghania sp.]
MKNVSSRHMSPSGLLARKAFTVFRRACRDESGVTAIEFAMVAVPFFALIVGIIEIGLMFFAGRILDNATADAARLIRTGQAYTQNFDAAAFRASVMSELPSFFTNDRLAIDVRTFETFAGINSRPPVEDGKLNNDNFTYVNPGPSQIVVVRVFYRWPYTGSYMGVNFADLDDGSRLLGAVQAFRTEPFPERAGGS